MLYFVQNSGSKSPVDYSTPSSDSTTCGGCCGARTWSLVIGWLQAIFGGIFAGVFTSFLALLVCVYNHPKDFPEMLDSAEAAKKFAGHHISFNNKITEAELPLVVTGIIINIVFSILTSIFGVVLIIGVKERHADKLGLWLIAKVLFILCNAFLLVVQLFFVGSAGDILRYVVSIILSIFFVWVVNAHRQELLGFKDGDSNPGINYEKNAI